MPSAVELSDSPLRIARGLLDNSIVVHKFGRADVGTSYVPIAIGGIYRTPQVSGATALRVKAGNTNDTAAGSGAQEITLQGIDETGSKISVKVATNGTSAGTATTETFIRLYRAFVSRSGTYASQSAGSHAAAIVIENSAGTEDWLTIDATSFPAAQSEVAVFTIPAGQEAYVSNVSINVDSNKSVSILFFTRSGILQTATPYDAMRVNINFAGISGGSLLAPNVPYGPYPELTDIGFMGKITSGTGLVSIDFEIICFDT